MHHFRRVFSLGIFVLENARALSILFSYLDDSLRLIRHDMVLMQKYADRCLTDLLVYVMRIREIIKKIKNFNIFFSEILSF